MDQKTYIRVDLTTGIINSNFEVVIIGNPDTGDPQVRMQVPTAMLDLLAPDFAAAGAEHERLKDSQLSDAEQGKLIFDAAYTRE